MLGLILIYSTALGITPECAMEWNKIQGSSYTAGLPSYYSKMKRYSGFEINNLGEFDSCNAIDESKFVVGFYSGLPLALTTLCGPKVCTEQDYLENTVPGYPYPIPPYVVTFPIEYQHARYRTYSSGAICMLVFIGVIFALGLASSLADYFLSAEDKTAGVWKYLLCFSLLSNGQRLLTTRSQERLGKADSLELLNGVRVMSIGWVVLGHVCLITSFNGANSNYDTEFNLFKETNFILVYGAFYAVDTFFWLSGLLMAYLFILEVNKTPSFSPWKLALVYVHRYLRITPVFMFVTLFFWSMQVYIGSGPLWLNIGSLIGDCDDHWYANMIYLNNFIPDWKVTSCIGVGWYLADDMQYFIISPIIILIYMKYSKAAGWGIVSALCLVCIGTSATVAHHFDLAPPVLAAQNGSDYNNYYYMKPYTRVAPYALGIACGFVLYSYRRYQDTQEVYDRFALFVGKMQEVWWVRVLSFGLGLGLVNVLIFSQYNTYKYPGESMQYDNWNNAQNYTFIAMERFVYGIAMSLMFLPMLLGYFRPITAFLSLYPWSIVARFNFVIYLIHYSIIQIFIKSQKTVLMVNEFNLIRDTIYFFLVSLLFSIPIVLLIEMPAGNIEKILFSKGPAPAKNKGEQLLNINEVEFSGKRKG